MNQEVRIKNACQFEMDIGEPMTVGITRVDEEFICITAEAQEKDQSMSLIIPETCFIQALSRDYLGTNFFNFALSKGLKEDRNK